MAEQLGYCDSQQFLAAHTKCDECVNWRPVSAPAPSPASEKSCDCFHDKVSGEPNHYQHHVPGCPNSGMSRKEIFASPASEQRARSFRRKWSKTGDVEADAEMLYAFATQEVAAERKRVREEDCKAVCVNCFNNIPVGEWCGKPVHWDVQGITWQACTAAAIRKLEER